MYVLGQVSPDEAKEVEYMVSQHAEVADELRAVQATMLGYGETVALEPPVGLEARILNKFETPQALMKKGGSNGLTYLLSGLLLASVIGLFYFFLQNKKTQKELEITKAELQQLQAECETIRSNNQRAMAYLDKVNAPGNTSVTIEGTPNAPGALAVVHWNTTSENTFLEIRNLTPPPPGKQYQLWAIVGGIPADMGVFDISADALALTEVPYIDNPQAFAVTLENEGGSRTPTLDQMVLIGNI